MAKWQKRILLTAWLTYASFYLVRVNLAVAVPGMIQEFGISKTAMGGVFTALLLAYAAGQFINGQIGDRFSPRKIVAFGLIFAAIINLIFGFTQGWITGLILLWALNGFFQSMGWAPTVKIIGNWFKPANQGRAAGILATSYQIGNAYSWALAGLVTGLLGWRWAFWFPTAIVILAAINWLFHIRNSPTDAGLSQPEKKSKNDPVLSNIINVLTNKPLWFAAMALFGLNIVRYGFIDWAPTYFFETHKPIITQAAFKSLIFPLAGSIGALFAGFLSDKISRAGRTSIAAWMILFLGIAIWIFPRIAGSETIWGLIVLGIIGFFTFGPHAMIVTAMPMEFGGKTVASATGFIDGWGYVGAALTGVGTGYLLDHFGWQSAFYFWLSGAGVAFILLVGLWNYQKTKILGLKNHA